MLLPNWKQCKNRVCLQRPALMVSRSKGTAFPAMAPLFVMTTHVAASRGRKSMPSTHFASTQLTAIPASSLQPPPTKPPTKSEMTSAPPRSPKISARRTTASTPEAAVTADLRQQRRARCRSSAQPRHNGRAMSPQSLLSRRSLRVPSLSRPCAT